MPPKIYVNLPVGDLNRSIAFFKSLGFAFNPQFTDETAACMIISEDIFAMLLTMKRFKDFTKKEIADASKTTEVLIAISRDSREQVNSLVDAALAAGATQANEPADHGFMFVRSFNDLDGHIWEIMHMDMSALPEAMKTA